jgi:putative flippase GtrA
MRKPIVQAREQKIEKTTVGANMIDIFYPIFRLFLSHLVYRYLAVGGICFFTNFCMFHISYHFIYQRHQISFLHLPSHFFSLTTSMCFTIPIGFYLNKMYVFANSKLLNQTQLIRYVLSTVATVAMSTILLDILITALKINITIAFIANVVIIQLLNYFIQKKFSFKQ